MTHWSGWAFWNGSQVFSCRSLRFSFVILHCCWWFLLAWLWFKESVRHLPVACSESGRLALCKLVKHWLRLQKAFKSSLKGLRLIVFQKFIGVAVWVECWEIKTGRTATRFLWILMENFTKIVENCARRTLHKIRRLIPNGKNEFVRGKSWRLLGLDKN